MKRYDWLIMGAIGALIATVFRGVGVDRWQASASTAAVCGAYEVGQMRISRPAGELDDFAGCTLGGLAAALIIPKAGAPKEHAAGVIVDRELDRIRRAIAAECDSVRRGAKTFTDTSMVTFAKAVCR
jgi:hypothetical protein